MLLLVVFFLYKNRIFLLVLVKNNWKYKIYVLNVFFKYIKYIFSDFKRVVILN